MVKIGLNQAISTFIRVYNGENDAVISIRLLNIYIYEHYYIFYTLMFIYLFIPLCVIP